MASNSSSSSGEAASNISSHHAASGRAVSYLVPPKSEWRICCHCGDPICPTYDPPQPIFRFFPIYRYGTQMTEAWHINCHDNKKIPKSRGDWLVIVLIGQVRPLAMQIFVRSGTCRFVKSRSHGCIDGMPSIVQEGVGCRMCTNRAR